ncbi:16S rRNA (guanine(527)-N(7))-methyltransferase RsmG [Sphingomonas donggukensis]|uniref:Ribosomal RNA small subunit methyltransferase G n=1 Tax=Sphingomonas donggukensis TaxID=2949093 RepID=A0ABY4TUX9_9SPHN|nr:16S rRNA (guanine(527)-N(7))-methyltransferase RsmG [Sphingomonas donggukensis]URW75282.1 16S rRNA (guanine(527)-N(7))-methyltransferase RsmG [Sphingomonas donggukensis]
MTEEEARAWIADRFGAAAEDRLDRYAAFLTVGADQQNLIAPSTVATMWSRHLVDSAQLLPLAPQGAATWADVGSGAGLPGLVVAVLSDLAVTLIEPRRLRVTFLEECAETLGIADRVTVVPAKAQNATGGPFDVISARAVATMPALFDATRHLSDRSTCFILPKGASAQSEVAAAERSWHGTFHVKQSIVNPNSGIVVATQVRRR